MENEIKLEPEYNADYFLNKFNPIAEERWGTLCYNEGEKFCVLGHCGIDKDNFYTEEERGLFELFHKAYQQNIFETVIPVCALYVNDGHEDLPPIFKDIDSPKQRIIKSLEIIKEKLV